MVLSSFVLFSWIWKILRSWTISALFLTSFNVNILIGISGSSKWEALQFTGGLIELNIIIDWLIHFLKNYVTVFKNRTSCSVRVRRWTLSASGNMDLMLISISEWSWPFTYCTPERTVLHWERLVNRRSFKPLRFGEGKWVGSGISCGV